MCVCVYVCVGAFMSLLQVETGKDNQQLQTGLRGDEGRGGEVEQREKEKN